MFFDRDDYAFEAPEPFARLRLRPTRKPRASVDLSQDMAVELLGIVERHVLRTHERDAEGVRDYLREQIQAALAEDRR